MGEVACLVVAVLRAVAQGGGGGGDLSPGVAFQARGSPVGVGGGDQVAVDRPACGRSVRTGLGSSGSGLKISSVGASNTADDRVAVFSVDSYRPLSRWVGPRG